MSKVTEAYNNWAHTYDRELNPSIELEHDRVVRILNPKEGDDILDVACGTGRYVKAAFERGSNVTGMDLTEAMLAEAKAKIPPRKRAPIVRYVQGDCTQVRFWRELQRDRETGFDKISCGLMIDHLLERQLPNLFKGMFLVLKPGGYAVVTTLHPETIWDFVKESNFKFALTSYGISHIHPLGTVESIARRSGFRVKIVELKIRHSIKHCFTPESYKKIRGMPFGVIYVLRKPKS